MKCITHTPPDGGKRREYVGLAPNNSVLCHDELRWQEYGIHMHIRRAPVRTPIQIPTSSLNIAIFKLLSIFW